MSYRRSEALNRLVAEVNKLAPKRDKTSDGWIGDAAHASRDSDHNPWVKDARGIGVVRAQDIDHDPDGGCDAARIADIVVSLLGKHPALGSGAYVIFRSRIISTDRRSQGWRPYSGVNAHKQHVHISVGLRGYDSTQKWGIAEGFITRQLKKVGGKWPVYFRAVKRQALKEPGKRKVTGSVRRVQKALIRTQGAKLTADGLWGPKTAHAYRTFQARHGFKRTAFPRRGSFRKLIAGVPTYRYIP